MNENTPETRQRLGAKIRDALGEKPKPPTFALATQIDRAIDLSCRASDACDVTTMGAGHGFPVGLSAPLCFRPQPPIQKTLKCRSLLNTFDMRTFDNSSKRGKIIIDVLRFLIIPI